MALPADCRLSRLGLEVVNVWVLLATVVLACYQHVAHHFVLVLQLLLDRIMATTALLSVSGKRVLFGWLFR